MATTRLLVCNVGFKQNVGYLGKNIAVCVVHGHARTMKMEWMEPYEHFWDTLARLIGSYEVKFLAGDFNMSLTQVVPRLRSRGFRVDCCAWYPWRHKKDTQVLNDQWLGFDSCGIFFIGGFADIKLRWDLASTSFLTAKGAELEKRVPGQEARRLRRAKLSRTTLESLPQSRFQRERSREELRETHDGASGEVHHSQGVG